MGCKPHACKARSKPFSAVAIIDTREPIKCGHVNRVSDKLDGFTYGHDYLIAKCRFFFGFLVKRYETERIAKQAENEMERHYDIVSDYCACGTDTIVPSASVVVGRNIHIF